MPDIEDEDLTTLDRGDDLPADSGSKDLPRDDQGRFAKKEDEPSDEPGEEVGESSDEPGEEVGEPSDEPGDEVDDADSSAASRDDKNYAIRIAKLKEQRDRERQRAEAAEKLIAEQQSAREQKPAAQATFKDKINSLNSELESLYEQVEEARLDGKTKDAAALQRKIDAANREILRIEAYVMSSKQAVTVQQNSLYDNMLDVIEAAYPEMDPHAEEYDPDIVSEMEDLVQAYESRGMSATDALRKATKVIFRDDPFVPKPRQRAAKEAPSSSPKVTPKKPDTKKALDTLKRQPPDTSGRGVTQGDDTKIRVAALSEEEFDSLPESKQKELRGDFD